MSARYYTVIITRDADQPMGVNHYRAELWYRRWTGRRLAMTEWRSQRWLALRDARRCFPSFEVQDD